MYKANASGGASVVTSDQITVAPLLAPAGNVALQFAASWGVLTGQGQTSKIAYNILAPGLGGQIQQVRLDGNGFLGGMFSSATVSDSRHSAARDEAEAPFNWIRSLHRRVRSQNSGPLWEMT